MTGTAPREPSEEAILAAAEATAELNRQGVGNPGPDFFSTPYARAAARAAYAVDFPSEPDIVTVALSEEEAQAAIAEIIGELRGDLRHGQACDRVLRKLRAKLSPPAGKEGEG